MTLIICSGVILVVLLTVNHRFVVHVKLKKRGNILPFDRGWLSSSTTTPIDCKLLLVEKQRQNLPFVDPNADLEEDASKYLVHVNRIEPAFWMFVHAPPSSSSSNSWVDPRSKAIQSQTLGEWEMEEIWRNLLQEKSDDAPSPGSKQVVHVLDVGSGLGYYSLAALATTHRKVHVHAFQVHPADNLRFCESLDANGWLSPQQPQSEQQQPAPVGSVRILSTGVSDRVHELPFHIPKSNPFMATFDPNHPLNQLDAEHVLKPILTLDSYATSMGWLTKNVREGATTFAAAADDAPSTSVAIKILRIDGKESFSSVLQGSEQLLQQHWIENVLVKISATTPGQAANAMVGVSLLLNAGYKLVGHGPDNVGPTQVVQWQHDANLVGKLVDAAQQEPLSAWFQYPMGRNRAYQLTLGRLQSSEHTAVKIPTIHCPRFTSDSRQGKLGIDDPNSGMDATMLRRHITYVPPSFWVSLHNKLYDRTRWRIMGQGHYYKTHQERIWREILEKAPRGAHVLDVGSNIGYFTLLSLAMGEFVVSAFEPNSANFLRLCESLELNRWTTANVQLHPVGVSDADRTLPFQIDLDNPGASRFLTDSHSAMVHTRPYQLTPVISLDTWAQARGWFDNNNVNDNKHNAARQPPPTVAILKVDVEGMEHGVVAGAQRLLRRVPPQNIFVELSVKDAVESNHTRQALSQLHLRVGETVRRPVTGNRSLWVRSLARTAPRLEHSCRRDELQKCLVGGYFPRFVVVRHSITTTVRAGI